MLAHFCAISVVPPKLLAEHKNPVKSLAPRCTPLYLLPLFQCVTYVFELNNPALLPGLAGAKSLYNSAAVEFVGLAVRLAAVSALMTASRHAFVSCKIVVGTALVLNRSSCKERKKNSLSLIIGPPKVRPNWLKCRGDLFTWGTA